EPAAGGGVFDEGGQAAVTGILTLGADHPVGCAALVPGCLILKELPRCLIGFERRFLLRAECRGLVLLKGVDGRPVFPALFESDDSGRTHAPFLGEVRNLGHVHLAPDAPVPARGEADSVALVVDALAPAVDPAEA